MKKIESDPTLLKEIRKYGPFDTNACLQCGSCTVMCDLSDDAASFPRKPIRYVLFGLRDVVQESLEPWLCHDCGTCSSTCPREAEPAEAMKTLRRYLCALYDWTGLSSKIYRSRTWEILSLVCVGLLVLLLVMLYHLYVAELEFIDFTDPLGMEHMFDKIKDFTLVVVLFPLLIVISHAFRMYWFTLHRGCSVKVPLRIYLTEVKVFILHSLTHKKLSQCPDKDRFVKHWLLAFGCVLKLIIIVFLLEWFQTDSIYPVTHPQRWLGYLITLFLVIGTTDIVIGRIRKKKEIYKSSAFSDFTFPVMLLLTALSGIAVHIFRYAGLDLASHFTYAIHLAIAVPVLMIEIPFGRWSHMIYRPLAIYLHAVKEKAMHQQLTTEESYKHAA